MVFAADNGNGYGNHIVVDHGGGYFTLYAHLDTIWVSTGQGVSLGQTIGQVGATGFVTGAHLHFEVRYSSSGGSWSYAIPRYYIPGADSAAVATGDSISFDYPNLGPLSGGSSPPPGGSTTPPPSTDDNSGVDPGFDGTSYALSDPSPSDGEDEEGTCAATSARGGAAAAWLIAPVLLLLALRRARAMMRA